MVAERLLNEGQPDGQPNVQRENSAQRDEQLLDEYSRTVVSAVQRVAPAVVNIEVHQRSNRDRATEVAGNGSGFIIAPDRSEEHTSELQSLRHLVCRLLL